MESIITIIIAIVLFFIIAYGLKWVCDSFALPQPVLWCVGALLLIVLLLAASRMVGLSGLPVLMR